MDGHWSNLSYSTVIFIEKSKMEGRGDAKIVNTYAGGLARNPTKMYMCNGGEVEKPDF